MVRRTRAAILALAAWLWIGQHATLDQFICDLAQFAVALLANPNQNAERLVPGELVPLHQDPFGLPDEIACGRLFVELIEFLRVGKGDCGVTGEQQPDRRRHDGHE